MKEKNFMKENKSFIMYKDWEGHFDMLTDEELGQLMRAVYRFVSTGEGTQFDDRALNMTFKMMTDCMLRDGEKWEDTKTARSNAGSKGGAPIGNKNACKNKQADISDPEKQPKQPKQPKQAKQPNQAVNVIVNDNENVNDNKNENKNVIVNADEKESENVNMIDSEPEYEPLGEKEYENIVERSSDMADGQTDGKQVFTDPYDFISLSEIEYRELRKKATCLTIEKYIRNIRAWQKKNRKYNRDPYASIKSWIDEDNAKKGIITYGSERKKAQKESDYDDYASFFKKAVSSEDSKDIRAKTPQIKN